MEGDWGGQIYLTCPLRILRPRSQVVEIALRPEERERDLADAKTLFTDDDIGAEEFEAIRRSPTTILALGEFPKEYETLLRELDRAAWDCNDGEGSSVRLHEATTPRRALGVGGGMGGGEITNGLWLHRGFTVGLDVGPTPENPTFWPRRAAEILGIVPSPR